MIAPFRYGSFLGVWFLLAGGPLVRADQQADFFEARIRPVLLGTCFRCHGDQKTSASLRVDSLAALLKGGDSGAAVVPGKPEKSLLIQVIQHGENVPAMPPGKEKALRPDQVSDFVTWIKTGATWPEKAAKFQTAKHWAFEPIREPGLPIVLDKEWCKNSIDCFIRARQEKRGLNPAPRADKRTLIRRVTFDLTGLPPTQDEVESFLKDQTPRAFETVVERLLNSPAYGERWGRHWLDVVRYADTAGETADYPVPQAWRYRNYVIDSFNKDKPYDQFLREQIAGDIIAKTGSAENYAETVAATGYLAISRRFGFDSENYHHLTIQDTIDTLGQSLLGLSLGCARCHDHKFDAVSMSDYYGLFGIFESSRYSFPGSEQKQKVRTLLPLLPSGPTRIQWHQYATRVAELVDLLGKLNQPAPAGILRSLHEFDGDFELQAPAAGGSNGVLVPPWLYEGPVAVTNAAQSPFRNQFSAGKAGASIPAETVHYRVFQTIAPLGEKSTAKKLHVNLDFRVAKSTFIGQHRFSLGSIEGQPTVSVLISSNQVSLKAGDSITGPFPLQTNDWNNLQLTLDGSTKTVTGSWGKPGAVSSFSVLKLPAYLPTTIDLVEFGSLKESKEKLPAIEWDNFAIGEMPTLPVSTDGPKGNPAGKVADLAQLNESLRKLTGLDGDFEMQTKDAPLQSPWNPGPNSIVRLTNESQSPFRNIYTPGRLGVHLPNREAYDGFGLTIAKVQPDKEGNLHTSFDFRLGTKSAGGQGSWRYYLGHGPGSSAAIELFFNGQEFFKRSGNTKEVVASLKIGEWYQVQIILDLKEKTYKGVLASQTGKTAFNGQLATGWDGAIDYSFIDSYGHLAGVRPSLDVDNFVVGDQPLPPLDATTPVFQTQSQKDRLTRIAEIRGQIATMESQGEEARKELNRLLVDGPFPMTYGMSEGTPHNSRIHLRGEPDQPGSLVPRGFIKALGNETLPREIRGSGRLELARWITRADHPLTARVMVNRIWQYHFGRGLVKTPNDFGVRGLTPTHPELLDHLAGQFIKNGWSVKSMHRLILLSATYQQSSLAPDHSSAGQGGGFPIENSFDLYAGFSRRRLSAEEIRDAILAVSGELDRIPGQEHPFPNPTSWGYTQHGPFIAVYDHNKRSVYLMIQRLKRHPFLALFDGADPNTTTPERLTTTVPTQALFFLNDPFVHEKSKSWAQRINAKQLTDEKRIDMAWNQSLGRSPSLSESTEARDFLAIYRNELGKIKGDQVEIQSLAAYLRLLMGSNEFLHVD